MSVSVNGEVDTTELRGVFSKIKEAAHSLRNVKGKATQIENLLNGIRSDAGSAERSISDLVAQAETLLVAFVAPTVSV
jgi:hypothetical protein